MRDIHENTNLLKAATTFEEFRACKKRQTDENKEATESSVIDIVGTFSVTIKIEDYAEGR